MACLQIASILLLLSLAKGAGSAATGEGCSVSAGCSEPNDICVPTVLKCLIKPNADCSVNKEKCVTGGSCGAGDKCTCDIAKHVEANPADYCKLQVDQACSSTTAPCLDNGECSTSTTTCVCKSGYVASTDKKTCLLKAGQTCTSDAQCTANSACSSGGTRTCTCSTNYVMQASGLCSPEDNTYGGSCNIANNVDSCVTNGTDPNAVCSAASGGTCGCKSGYTATVGAKCSPEDNTYGGSCNIANNVDSCVTNGTDPNAVCSAASGGTCGCKSGYTATVGAKCSPEDNTYGGSCAIAKNVDSCVSIGADPNAVCSAASGGTCGCKSGYTATVGAKCSGAMTFAGSVLLLVAALILTTYLQ